MLAQIRDALAQVHPDFPWAFLAFSLWIVQYLVRRFLPKVWVVAFSWVPEDLPDMGRRVIQALPSILIGAAIPAAASGGNVRQAMYGAFFGTIAPLWHHLWKAVPVIPYQGNLGAAPVPQTPEPPRNPA